MDDNEVLEPEIITDPVEMGFTKEDFDRPDPYEAVYRFKGDPFQHELMINKMAAYASAVGVRNFKTQYKAYIKGLKNTVSSILVDNATQFTGQPLELTSGEWYANDDGINRKSNFGREIACPHPIMPVMRYMNVDTGETKLKLWFRRGETTRSVIIPRTTLASATKVTELASYGIGVTSSTARSFVDFIADMESLNYDIIPEQKSIGRLGYIDGYGFSPYVEGLEFDGDAQFASLYRTVRQVGSYKKWKAIASKARENKAVKIVLAASFASPLISRVDALPFFVHMWCPESGTGKTVSLMLAASVWGDPAVGEYVKSFNSTKVGMEKMAAFLNHLPLCLDELQLTKGTRGETNFSVYDLASGVSRTRSNKLGGLDQTLSWANTIITTGESQLNNQSSGSGAVNRVIDIACNPGEPLIADGNKVSAELRANFGHAGKDFVQHLYQMDKATLKARYDELFNEIQNYDTTTDKQALSAAALLLADELVCKWILQGEQPLTVAEIMDHLAEKEAVDIGTQAYQFICSWVVQHQRQMLGAGEGEQVIAGDIYGYLDNELVCILKNVFEDVLKNAGFQPSSVVTSFKAKGLLKLRKNNPRHYTMARKIGRAKQECYCIYLPKDDDDDDDGMEDMLPF